MKRNLFFAAFFVLIFFHIEGQTPVGTWSDHLVYNTSNAVAVGSDEVYASTGSSVIVYDKALAELRKLTRINGLTETGISSISWSEEQNMLVIGYTSANIDLVEKNTIYNIPDIARKYLPGKKTINRIRTSGKYAYFACSFGIVVADLSRKEIYDTWKPGSGSESNEVFDVATGNGKIYAATANGIYFADLSHQGLSYFGNWEKLNGLPVPSGKYNLLAWSGKRLVINLADPLSGGDSVYMTDGTGSNVLLSFAPGIVNNSLDASFPGFTVSSSSSIKYFDSEGVLKKTISSYGWGTMNVSQSIADNGNIWIADISNGLVSGENMSEFRLLTFPGPVSNNAYYITSHNGKTVVSGGGTTGSWNNQRLPLQISIFENNQWSSITSATIIDPLRSLIDPANHNHIFVTTWGGGLLEYMNNVLVKQYTDANSRLETIIPNAPYVRVCGLAMDKRGNIWVTQTEVPGSIKMMKPDGSWVVFPEMINALNIGDIIVARNGYKWVTLPRGAGIFVLDDNNTPDNFSDDRTEKLNIMDGNTMVSKSLSVAEDLDGNIWVGTDQGPFVYYNPEKVFEGQSAASRIKIPRKNDPGYADYMLKNEVITAIAIDGANRKWMGTAGSGAYLLSADGTEELKHFDEQNSPILSNSVISLAVDNITGEVWFGTSKGIQSYRSDATGGGNKFSKIYSFPNPVRENFTGNVTITGLVRDTEVKITDISGNLVYETMSNGGQASWNLQNYRGTRVSTGVYLVFCSNNDGTQAAVTKILVVH